MQTYVTPPRSYLDKIRRGHDIDKLAAKRLDKEKLKLDNSKNYALKLTQILVRNGYSDAYITRAHLKRQHLGFTWVQNQDNPHAASAELLKLCKRNLKPVLPKKHRHARLLERLQQGDAYVNGLVKYVGNAYDRYTRQDIEELREADALDISDEQHGKDTWHRVTLLVDAKTFWEISKQLRKEQAKEIARRYSAQKIARELAKQAHLKEMYNDDFYADTNPAKDYPKDRPNSGLVLTKEEDMRIDATNSAFPLYRMRMMLLEDDPKEKKARRLEKEMADLAGELLGDSKSNGDVSASDNEPLEEWEQMLATGYGMPVAPTWSGEAFVERMNEYARY